jgi:HAD superfamily hydrolase (TIGR01509 family)
VVSDQPLAAFDDRPFEWRTRALSDSLPRPEGVIFDLDGTLVDTVSARIAGWVEALEAAGIAATREQIAPMIGMDGKRLARLVAADAGRALEDREVEATDKAAGEAFDRLNRTPRRLPDVRELLATIEDAGIPWVIATSSRKEQVTTSVAALALESQPAIVDGSHVEHAKPAPDLLLVAAERLGVGPAACWAVGDSTWDMRAAIAGGMTAIGVTAGSAVSADSLVEAGASLVVSTLGELIGTFAGSIA